MKKYVLVIFILSVIILGCDKSDDKSGKNSKTDAENPQGKNPPKNDDAKICHPVSNKAFLNLTNGVWQSFRPGMMGPDCLQNRETQEIMRSFLRIDRRASTTYGFNISYGSDFSAVKKCKESVMELGAELQKSPPLSIELCQSKELVTAFGNNYYFMKTREDRYQIVGTTTDSLGRLVLLLGWSRSSSPHIDDNAFQMWINHDDYRSVKIYGQ